MTLPDRSEGSPEKRAGEVDRLIPAGLLWLHAVSPRIFTPMTLEKGGMAEILFRGADSKTVVTVIRTIMKYSDGSTGIQDEIHRPFVNRGTQYNFECNPEGELVQYPTSPDFPEHMQDVLDRIEELSRQGGTTIEVHYRDFDGGARFTSDGQAWHTIDGLPIPEVPPLDMKKPMLYSGQSDV